MVRFSARQISNVYVVLYGVGGCSKTCQIEYGPSRGQRLNGWSSMTIFLQSYVDALIGAGKSKSARDDSRTSSDVGGAEPGRGGRGNRIL